MGMLALNVKADLNVISLIGERGREVREFIEHSLGPEGLAKTIMVVVTSDKSPALQVKGSFLATTIAEHFRNQGKDVRDDGFTDSIGACPTSNRTGRRRTSQHVDSHLPYFHYFPNSWSAQGPVIMEGASQVYTVLVEGDDIHDPIGDAVRGIVDGHIVLSRKLASHGHTLR